MAKKTKDRDATQTALIEQANKYFLNSSNDCAEYRRFLQNFVTSCLPSNVYRGFRYLTEEEMPDGLECGIIFDPIEFKHTYPDETRISFY